MHVCVGFACVHVRVCRVCVCTCMQGLRAYAVFACVCRVCVCMQGLRAHAGFACVCRVCMCMQCLHVYAGFALPECESITISALKNHVMVTFLALVQSQKSFEKRSGIARVPTCRPCDYSN